MSRGRIIQYCVLREEAERRLAEACIDAHLAETHRAMATCFRVLLGEVAADPDVKKH